MKIIIVDENDKIIGYKKRRDVKPDDIYRVSALWITNSQDEVLLAQRSFNKKNSPGKWATAVAGTLEEGETYEANVIKEAKEELGLTDFPLELGPKTKGQGKHVFFCQWFFTKIDINIDDLTLQKEEVEQVAWLKRQDLLSDIYEHPEIFTENTPRFIENFLS